MLHPHAWGPRHYRSRGKRSLARPGSLAWIDTSRRYAHHCHGESDAWHYLWIGVDGAGMAGLHAELGFREEPVVNIDLEAEIRAILDLARSRDPNAAATANAAIAMLLSAIAPARMIPARSASISGDPAIEALIAGIRHDIAADWSVPRMAAVIGVSSSQFHRRFALALGLTPAKWLRQERINLARRYLKSGFEKVAAIALRCGYDDPFHFSRDFRSMTGLSPTAFRNHAELDAG
ncbi:MAG: AraC family transcriptional regulator [Hyphomicrobiales bacterium]|nr:MAG: AraC family transcriptional regulator [Hyphomicrobiales bacterium]